MNLPTAISIALLSFLIWVFGSATVTSACTPAQRAQVIPVLSQVDAIGSTVAQAIAWCEDHGAEPADVLEALKAVSEKDPGTAAVVAHRILSKMSAKGVPIPPEIVALVQTAEGALAAQAIQDGMTRLSTGGAPNGASSSSTIPTPAPLPSSGL